MSQNQEAPYVMTIEIDEGKIEKLNIYFDTNPEQLAYDFCRQRNLDFSALQYLSEEIRSVLQNKYTDNQKRNYVEEGIKEVNESQEVLSDELRKIRQTSEYTSLNNVPNAGNPPNNTIDTKITSSLGNQICNDGNKPLSIIPQGNDKVMSKKNSNSNLTANRFFYNKSSDHTRNSSINKQYSETNQMGDRGEANQSRASRSINENLKHDDEVQSRTSANIEIPVSKVTPKSNYILTTGNIALNKNSNSSSNSTKVNVFNRSSSSFSQNRLTTTNLNATSKTFISAYNMHKEQVRMKLLNKHGGRQRYSFSPEVNKRSDAIVRNRNNAMNLENSKIADKHNQLYEQYKHRQQINETRTEEFYKQYSFSPKINIYNFNMNFFERQEVYKHMKMEKEKEKELNRMNPKDTFTNQKLFSPVINPNASSPKRHSENLNDYLFSYSGLFKLKKNTQTLGIEEDFRQRSNSKHTQKHSELLYKAKKTRTFTKIFRLLDVDEDNSISQRAINLRGIGNELRRLLTPILNKLKEEGCSINRSDFIEYCDVIYEACKPTEKQIFLDFEKNLMKSRGMNSPIKAFNENFIKSVISNSKSKSKL